MLVGIDPLCPSFGATMVTIESNEEADEEESSSSSNNGGGPFSCAGLGGGLASWRCRLLMLVMLQCYCFSID